MAVAALLDYGLTVPDPAAGRDFYATFGLDASELPGGIALRAPGRGHDEVLLAPGARKRLRHLSFAVDAAGLQAIRARGATETAPPADGLADALPGTFVADPDGNRIRLTPAPAPASRTVPAATVNWPGAYARIGSVGCPPRGRVSPVRLGHVLLFTPRLKEMLDFYVGVLGMRLADRSGDLIAFLHLAGGGDHHVVALARSAAPGFHHASFEAPSLDAVGMGARQVIEAGYPDAWGLGRHVIGSNYFHYVRDPWMSCAEYFFDIDRIPADGSWQPRDHPHEDALYRWGPPPPADFIRNFEIEG